MNDLYHFINGTSVSTWPWAACDRIRFNTGLRELIPT
jgi:hypothetical protein